MRPSVTTAGTSSVVSLDTALSEQKQPEIVAEDYSDMRFWG